MRSKRPYVQLDPAVIEQARQMDLLSYLQPVSYTHLDVYKRQLLFPPTRMCETSHMRWWTARFTSEKMTIWPLLCLLYTSLLTKQLCKEQGVTEELKEKAPMQWVGQMCIRDSVGTLEKACTYVVFLFFHLQQRTGQRTGAPWNDRRHCSSAYS